MDIKLSTIGMLAIGVVACSLTAACASGPKAESDAAVSERVCINGRTVRNFDALTDRYVYVRESRDRHYLITTRFRCNDLQHAFTIAFSDTTSRICARGFAKIVYQDRLNDSDFRDCPIKEIIRVDDKDHARRIVAGLTGAPASDPGTWSDVPESGEAESDKPEPESDGAEAGQPEPDVPDTK